MFNIKVYNRNWVFIQTLRESEISCKYSFSASVNSGFSSLSFEYYWDYKLEHKQRIKIYKQWKAIYQWFITWVSIKADKSGKKQIIKCSWLLWLLSIQTLKRDLCLWQRDESDKQRQLPHQQDVDSRLCLHGIVQWSRYAEEQGRWSPDFPARHDADRKLLW